MSFIKAREFTLFAAALLAIIGMLESTRPALADDRIAAVERGLDLDDLMAKDQVPGISVAVIDNFKIAWAKGYGVTEKDGTLGVTPRTLFLAGSISKPVTAVGAMYLVEHGKLSLDADINTELKSWKVPDNDYTRQHSVTLGLLLDHTGGFTGGEFFPGYTVSEALPSLRQILDGLPPANNDPMRVGYVPGSKWQYSGDGYLVIQQLMTDTTGESFPQLMRELVFDKLGMHDTTFEEPLPAARVPSAAAGTLMNGKPVPGRWHVTPEMAAGGLWSTPTDLAKLAIEIALSERGKSNQILSRESTDQMLRPHWTKDVINILGTSQNPDAMGMGFFVGDGHRFGHIGGNVGYQAMLLMFGDTGKGAVIMTNSDIGLQVGDVLLDKIAKVYGWDYTAPPPP